MSECYASTDPNILLVYSQGMLHNECKVVVRFGQGQAHPSEIADQIQNKLGGERKRYKKGKPFKNRIEVSKILRSVVNN